MSVLNATHVNNMGGDNLCDYHGVDYSYGSYGVCIVVVFFQFVNWIIKSIGPPKSLRNDEWKWRNLTISYLHAFACVIWIVTSFVVQPELFSDLQHFKSHLIVGVLTFTTGYFMYDFLDLALNGKMFSMWEVQLHHVSVGFTFYYNLVCCEWVSFNTIALLVEVNSFFLHQRKLLQMLGTPYDAALYRVTAFLNLSTFVVFRGISILFVLWGMWALYHLAELYFYICLCWSMFFMVVMNPILFMRLLRSDYLRDGSRGKQQKEEKEKMRHEKIGVNRVINGNNNNCLVGRVQDHWKQS